MNRPVRGRLRFLAVAWIAAIAVAYPLAAQDIRRSPAPADIDAILAEGFPSSRDRLAKLLTAAYQPGAMGMAGSSGSPAFTSWLTLWRWCELLSRTEEEEAAGLVRRHVFIDQATGKNGLLPPGENPATELKQIPLETAAAIARQESDQGRLFSRILPPGNAPATGLITTRLNTDCAAALLRDQKFSRAFFAALSPTDYAPLVLANLQAIYSASPAKFAEYANLAIALAVVNDSKFPAYWPHRQVKRDLVPREELPVAEQFAAWVAANESRALITDLRKLSPEHLKFVVDAPVARAELEWARKNIRLPRVNFDRAFSMVKYRNDRLAKQQYEWTESPYQLQKIRELGGICVDQAYFAILAGKALGLPTLFFTGQGTDGGHAWFGYLKADEQWELNSGRYATQKFATGQALDPQSWKPISDHELEMLAARFRDQPAFLASSADLLIAALLEKAGDTARAAKALESAVRTCPRHHEAWQAQRAFLARTGASPAARKTFHEAALKQFGTNSDLKAEHRRELAALARECGDTSAANRLERLILMENRNKRADLSVGIAAQQINALLAAGKLDEAGKEFRSQLASLGESGGGNLFYDVVSPYVLALIEANRKPEARRVLESVRKKLAPEEGGILDVDLTALEDSAK